MLRTPIDPPDCKRLTTVTVYTDHALLPPQGPSSLYGERDLPFTYRFVLMASTCRPVQRTPSASSSWVHALLNVPYEWYRSTLVRIVLPCCVLLLAGSLLTRSPAYGQQAFITTWETTSSNESITIPTRGEENMSDYNMTIDWGDGTSESISGTDPDPSHTYSSAGTYTVKIRGTFPHLFLDASFAGDGDPQNAQKLQTIEQWGDIGWESMNSAFEGAKNVTDNTTDVPDLSQVSSMRETFRDASVFNGDVTDWDVSEVRTMRLLFDGASDFNRDIGDWNVSNVTDMGRLFRDAETFNQDIGSWDVSSVTHMPAMFKKALAFNQDIGGWDVSNVRSMARVFVDATSFNRDIGAWDVSNVTNMSIMFEGATAFNQDIASWDVSAVTDMSDMFRNATAFNQDISAWDVSNVESFHGLEGFLSGARLSSSNYDALLEGWQKLDLRNGRTFHAGSSTYSERNGAPARAAISTDDNWSFTDGGVISASAITLTDGSNFDPAVLDEESDDNPVGRLEMNANTAGASTPSVIVATCGTNEGVEMIRLWHSSSPTFDPGTANVLASRIVSPSTSTPSTILFTGFQQSIPTSNTYLYTTADVTPDASGAVQMILRKGTDLMRDGGTLTNGPEEFPMPLSSTATALPTQTDEFTAILDYARSVLSWHTNSDDILADFNILRRTSTTRTWTSVGTTKNTGETSTSFQFVDENVPTNVDTVHYRLEQRAPNGCVYRSKSVALEIDETRALSLEKLFPNPVQETVTVRYAVPSDIQDVRLELFDLLGRQVRLLQPDATEGRHELQIDANRLSSGTYILRIAAGGESKTERFVVVK